MTDSLIRGPFGFTEGGDALAESYVRAIREHGGEVLLRTKAVKIETREGAAVAVHTAEGERFQARKVISGVHPKLTFNMVDRQEIFSPAFRMRLANIRESVGLFGLYGLYSRAADLNPLRNYFYFGSANPDELFTYGQPNERPNAAFLCPSERMARAHGAPLPVNIHAVGPYAWFSEWKDTSLGKRPEAYSERKSLYADKLLELIDGSGLAASSEIKKYITSTPLSNLHFNGSVEGSSYGIYHSFENVGARAIGPRTHVADLFLTGQNTVFPGILAAAISGMKTAGHIIGIKPLLKELKDLRIATAQACDTRLQRGAA